MRLESRYVKPEPTTVEKTGAIIPMSLRKIYQSGGTLKSTDRQLYMIERIKESLDNATVQYKGNTYSIEEDTDYTDYSDVSAYVLRWVGQ